MVCFSYLGQSPGVDGGAEGRWARCGTEGVVPGYGAVVRVVR